MFNKLIIIFVKDGGKASIHIIQKLFTTCLLHSQWHKDVIVIIHKKGTMANFKNYGPINFLLHTYKLFMKIIKKRLINKLDSYQSKNHGYRTNGHLQVVKTSTAKCAERTKPLIVDCDNALYTID